MSERLEGFNGFADEKMKEWKVPGCALAVIKEGEVIFSEGFGLRDVENGQKVTSDTLFAIGSCTKAFTAMALGILVEEGKLDWDKPVRDYLPVFRMHDPVATERMTPRDLVTHRSGLPRHDAVWYGSSFTREELFARLRYLEPNRDFRFVWQYQNLMYMAAGYLAGHIAGCTWEEFVRQRILDPLGMDNSNFSVSDSPKSPDFALPYMEKKEEVRQVPFRNIDSIGPAGSINSSVTDMARWLLLNLNKGKCGDTQVISEGGLSQMHSPQMAMPGSIEFDEVSYASYGLGWAVFTYRGRIMVAHGGGIDGFSSQVTLLPKDNTGIVVLTNLGGTPLPTILTYNLCDRLLGLDEIPWSDRIREKVNQDKEKAQKAKEEAASDRKTGTAPSHPLEDYTGTFEHPAYGIASIEIEGDRLKATRNAISGPLEHFHYDIFELRLEAWDTSLKVSFLTDAKGNIGSFSVPYEQGVKEIVFTRAAEKEERASGDSRE